MAWVSIAVSRSPVDHRRFVSLRSATASGDSTFYPTAAHDFLACLPGACGRDRFANERADHSLRIPRPDLSARLGTPNACSQGGCHDDKPFEWSVEAFTKWYGQAKKFLAWAVAGMPGHPGAERNLRAVRGYLERVGGTSSRR